LTGEPQDIREVLEGIAKALDDLLSLSKEKQDSVVRGDIPHLESILMQEQDLVYRLNLLEQERIRLYAGNPPEEEEVRDHIESLRVKASLLKSMNEKNQKIIAKTLEIIGRELGILQPQEGYGGKGAKTNPRVFDRKI